MLATATHDHKRGEDVRAPPRRADARCRGEWRRPACARWARRNRLERTRGRTAERVPEPQRRVPALPDPGRRLAARDRDAGAADLAELTERIVAYMHQGAARGQGAHELDCAGRRQYEAGAERGSSRRMLDPQEAGAFLERLSARSSVADRC